MKKVNEDSFRPYGRILNLDVTDFIEAITSQPATPAGQVVYEPSGV